MNSGRPEHPDFFRLCEIINTNDTAADAGESLDEIIERYADPASLLYVAGQRALRAVTNSPKGFPVRSQLMAMFLDGFMTGVGLGQANMVEADPDGSTRTEAIHGRPEQ